uniref:Putative polysaccharide deacetylase n=1 Tax=viral metagenome TaxID=1070528 RepID=A0A6M3LXI1_9ZZZZ
MTTKAKKKTYVIASVDDGDRLDMAVADMFLKYRIPAVFYIAPEYSDLSDTQVKRLAGIGPKGCSLCKQMGELFEIGAHTMTHPRDLKELSDDEVRAEVLCSKEYLEKITSKPVTKFCYPRGKYDDRIKRIVKECGFEEARTVKIFNTDFPKDPFETHASIHIHPARAEYGDRSWMEYGHELLEKVLKKGGRFEVWMHGWEIDKFNHWEFVDDFLWHMRDQMDEYNYKT